MGSGKTQEVMEKKLTGPAKTGSPSVMGNLRWQHYDDGKIHVHDDTKKLVFEYGDGEGFQIAIDQFLREGFMKIKPGKQAIVRGTPGPKAADLVFAYSPAGWEIFLAKAGKENGIIIADPVLSKVGDFLKTY